MKRALYIGGFCMPEGNAAAQRVLGIAKLLRECDYDVRFCGLDKNIIEPKDGTIDGFDYRNYPYPKSVFPWWRYLTGNDYALTEIDSYRPDMVILYNHPALAIERILKYCHRKGIKVIADITEWYEAQGGFIFRTIKNADVNRRMHVSHKKLDGLICISNYLADYYKSTGIPVLNLPPLVDLSQAKWHQKIESRQDVIKLVYAGSPGSSKDRLDLIIKALDEIIPSLGTGVMFDVIGITAEQYRSTWNDVKEYPFAVFHGRIPHLDVVKHLLGADFQIFLRPDTLPNRAGFPTKFVESVTSKTLPITNLSSNLSDYMQNGVNGFVVDSLDLNSIGQALRNAMQLSSHEIEFKKSSLDSNMFDYRNYTGSATQFLKLISGNS